MAILTDAKVSTFIYNLYIVVFAHLAHELAVNTSQKLRFSAEMAQLSWTHLSKLFLVSPPH